MADPAVGFEGYLEIDDSAGTLTDVSDFVTGTSPAFDKQIFDITTFGNNGSRAKTTGLKDGKFPVDFFSDPIILSHLIGLWGMARGSTHSFVYGPHGNTTGKVRVAGELVLQSLPLPAVVDDVERIQAAFECTGTVTFDLFT
jgi:hypothetical protein